VFEFQPVVSSKVNDPTAAFLKSCSWIALASLALFRAYIGGIRVYLDYRVRRHV
jgi:hypothetical protein